MTLAHAKALLPDDQAIIQLHHPHRESAALHALARWALRFSPIVAVDPPNGLMLDVVGCERLFSGEKRLLDMILQAVHRLGFHVRIALAATFGCAWAAARFAATESTIVPVDREREILAPLPLQALRIDEATIGALEEIGIERIEHLSTLPRAALTERFGSEVIRRFDQAVGRAAETIAPIHPVLPLVVERLFSGPVKQIEAIELTARQLLDDLETLLEQRESGIRQLILQLDRIDAPPVCERIMLSCLSRDARHLWTLMRPKVESINLGYGVERVILRGQRVGGIAHEQTKHWITASQSRTEIDQAFGRFVDALTNRCGSNHVVRVEPIETHIPEQVFQQHPALEHLESKTRDHTMLVNADRPPLLFEHPEKITVMALTPDGPPVWLKWRSVERRVSISAGPERIVLPWWDTAGMASNSRSYWRTRDYFKVQDEHGCWLWIYHEPDCRGWFIHGLWS